MCGVCGKRDCNEMELEMTKIIRWNATVYYRSDMGLVDVIHDIEELEDLHQLVESGPDWNTIDKIEIVRIGNQTPNLTIEEAMKL
jgi:hypothetical protein